ncbi:hypothetical protein [Streptomyces sp. R35]|uniref:Uncharacterized protein n=1 Tax=Streptomyces sp. R35 TaxID=3238630 RepID=A0AB39SIC7_9ACTN
MPDPSWMAQQQAQQAAQQAQQIHQNNVRHHRHMHDMARIHGGTPQMHRPMPYNGSRGGSVRGFLTLLVIVAVVVYVAHDPELRTTVTTFARNLLARVQSN